MAHKTRSTTGLKPDQQASTLRKLSLLAIVGGLLIAFCFWADSIKVGQAPVQDPES